MIGLEEARQIASQRLGDISGCVEYDTAWAFYNQRTAESDGGPDASAVVLKESGKLCGFIQFIGTGGGKLLREIRFEDADTGAVVPK